MFHPLHGDKPWRKRNWRLCASEKLHIYTGYDVQVPPCKTLLRAVNVKFVAAAEG